jgi:16S rRNA (cytosine1402-N4)-methyltransferase
MAQPAHIPVLFDEVLDGLSPQPNGRFIDGTLGNGGHTAGLLHASAPDGRVLAFDRDQDAIDRSRQHLAEFGERVTIVHASYVEMAPWAEHHGFAHCNGILLDLGVSSPQLDEAERGFSFMKEGPLDMRFDQSRGETAADLVNKLNEAALAQIFWEYGEERQSRKLARHIVQKRPFFTTTALAEMIEQVAHRQGRLHPATRVFQALRIAVNDELTAVSTVIDTAVPLLAPGGRLAIISFHSLEDRLVKRAFRRHSATEEDAPTLPTGKRPLTPTLRLINKKPIQPSQAEIGRNPRSRSAKLRVAEKL